MPQHVNKEDKGTIAICDTAYVRQDKGIVKRDTLGELNTCVIFAYQFFRETLCGFKFSSYFCSVLPLKEGTHDIIFAQSLLELRPRKK